MDMNRLDDKGYHYRVYIYGLNNRKSIHRFPIIAATLSIIIDIINSPVATVYIAILNQE